VDGKGWMVDGDGCLGRSATQIIRKGLTESNDIRPKAVEVEMHVPSSQP
jgi:hypothetical protein